MYVRRKKKNGEKGEGERRREGREKGASLGVFGGLTEAVRR